MFLWFVVSARLLSNHVIGLRLECPRHADSGDRRVETSQHHTTCIPAYYYQNANVTDLIMDHAERGSGDSLFGQPTNVLQSPGAASFSAGSFADPYLDDQRYQDLSSELRSFLLATAQSTCPTRAHTPGPAANLTIPSEYADVIWPNGQLDLRHTGVPVMDSAKYLRNWLTECAPWLDMFDQSRMFGSQVPCLAKNSPAILYAMLALSARQSARQSDAPYASEHSFDLYAKAIASLSAALDTHNPCIPVAACILCVLEMMSANPRNWKHHLEGCAALFEASGIHGLSGGLHQAVFWCFARMDLCSAIIDGGVASTVIPIEKWAIIDRRLAPDLESDDYVSGVAAGFAEQASHSHDMRANHAVYLCAKVCDLLARRTRYVEMGEENGYNNDHFSTRWSSLWEELQLWVNGLPADFLPFTTVVDQQGFPRKLFSQYAAISSTQLYHTACILMLDARAPGVTGGITPSTFSILWHAKQVVGISLGNEHRGCLNNAIQPLYVAGRHFTHRDEHATVMNLLRKIENKSGWAAKWRIKDLETMWGY